MTPSVPSAADVELGQVVAGHVLDNAAARFDLLSFVVDRAHAQHVVAQGPVAQAARPADVGRQRAADRRLFRPGHVDRQMLILAGQQSLQGRNGHAGLDGHGHVGGGIVDHGVEAADVESNAGFRRNATETDLRSPAEGIHALPRCGGAMDKITHIRRRGGRSTGRGPKSSIVQTFSSTWFGSCFAGWPYQRRINARVHDRPRWAFSCVSGHPEDASPLRVSCSTDSAASGQRNRADGPHR